MNNQGKGGQGRQRAGQKKGGQGLGRKGRYAAGPEGICACPGCGYEQPHERGLPCPNINCPKCGKAMVRK